MAEIVLSRRLETIAGMVGRCRCLADIGTDHAYLPICLVKRGIADKAIAADIGRGPLERARENIRTAGLSDKIRTVLSDGFRKLCPGEADAAVVSGMGGLLMVRILSDSPETIQALNEIILEPQSETAALRRYVTENGFYIEKEALVLERGKYYPVIRCRRIRPEMTDDSAEPNALTDEEAAFGPCLLRNHDENLFSLLKRRKDTDDKILESLRFAASSASDDRKKEVEKELAMIEAALGSYEMR